MSSIDPGCGVEFGYLADAEGDLFAAYHPPSGSVRRDVGVVFVDPIGSLRMSIHLTDRLLALALAEEGYGAMRIDPYGTCDSDGDPRGLDQIAASARATELAIDFVKARAFVERVVLVGSFFGGTLACHFASRRSDVAGVVAWGALPSGRAFLREAVAFQRMRTANLRGLRPVSYDEGDEELRGFRLSKPTLDAIGKIDLTKLSNATLPRAVLLCRNRTASTKPLVEALRKAGVDAVSSDYEDEGFERQLDTLPCPPARLIEAMKAGVMSCGSPTPVRRSSEPVEGPTLASRHRLIAPSGRTLVEQVVRFGPDGQLFGVLVRPRTGYEGLPAVVFVNGGTNHRVGINRNYVDWGRTLAGTGFVVLRIDTRGLGDSPPLQPGQEAVLYRQEAREDVKAAVDFLETRVAPCAVACVGVCAGGYQSLHAAIDDRRIDYVGMLNPLRTEPNHDSQLVVRGRSAQDYAPVEHYLRALRDPQAWRRLIARRAEIPGIARSVGGRLMVRIAAKLHATPLRPLVPAATATSWIAARVAEFAKRGTRVFILFDDTNPIRGSVVEHLAALTLALSSTRRLEFAFIEESDHIFTPLVSQETVWAILFDSLKAFAAEASAASAGRAIAANPGCGSFLGIDDEVEEPANQNDDNGERFSSLA